MDASLLTVELANDVRCLSCRRSLQFIEVEAVVIIVNTTGAAFVALTRLFLAVVRAQLGETLLWMIVSPSAYAEQKAPWVSSMRAEAVSQLEKAAGFLTAVTKVKPLTDKAAAVRRR